MITPKVPTTNAVKPLTQFRNFRDSAEQRRVESLYAVQHKNQTFDRVIELEAKHLAFNKLRLSAWDALVFLDSVTDESDPDTNASQLQHALQSAEAARKARPDDDWLHLTCLIHDLGKLLAVTDPRMGLHGEPQWAVVGDTFPFVYDMIAIEFNKGSCRVGCRFDESNVFHDSFSTNDDYNHPIYSTKLGIYTANCGLDNVKMSWGHDEYLYRVLLYNKTTLPPQALSMIRFHSFYPWHTGNGYQHLCNEDDERRKKWVLMFNEFDLYSKSLAPQNVEQLRPYYQNLIEKYLPPVLQW